MAFSIEHVSIRCRDLETSIDFFQRMFGAEIMLRRHLDGSKRILFLRIGDTMLELMDMGPASEPVDPMQHYGVHHIGIKVDDFESTYRDLQGGQRSGFHRRTVRANSRDSVGLSKGAEWGCHRVGTEGPPDLSGCAGERHCELVVVDIGMEVA